MRHNAEIRRAREVALKKAREGVFELNALGIACRLVGLKDADDGDSGGTADEQGGDKPRGRDL